MTTAFWALLEWDDDAAAGAGVRAAVDARGGLPAQPPNESTSVRR